MRRLGLLLGTVAAGTIGVAAPVVASADTGPVVAVTAAGSFFPVHDGYQDVFAVTITTDEEATAHLYLRDGNTIVARGVKALDEDAPVTVTAGAGLRPGRYTWDLAITDLAGNTTTTPLKTVVADGRRLVSVTETKTLAANKLPATLHHGSCATATSTGSGIVLTSRLQCSSNAKEADTATASLTFPLLAGATYDKLQVATTSVGNNGVFTAFEGATQHVGQAGAFQAPTSSITLAGSLVSPAHTLRFQVQTSAGERLTLRSVTVRYLLGVLR